MGIENETGDNSFIESNERENFDLDACKRIVKTLKGDLVCNKLEGGGKGFEFVLSFPLEQIPALNAFVIKDPLRKLSIKVPMPLFVEPI